MGLYESMLMTMTLCCMSMALWKWSNTLLTLISLEISASMFMTWLFLLGETVNTSQLLILVFFVIESLLLLSSLFVSLRSCGLSRSGLMLS